MKTVLARRLTFICFLVALQSSVFSGETSAGLADKECIGLKADSDRVVREPPKPDWPHVFRIENEHGVVQKVHHCKSLQSLLPGYFQHFENGQLAKDVWLDDENSTRLALYDSAGRVRFYQSSIRSKANEVEDTKVLGIDGKTILNIVQNKYYDYSNLNLPRLKLGEKAGLKKANDLDHHGIGLLALMEMQKRGADLRLVIESVVELNGLNTSEIYAKWVKENPEAIPGAFFKVLFEEAGSWYKYARMCEGAVEEWRPRSGRIPLKVPVGAKDHSRLSTSP